MALYSLQQTKLYNFQFAVPCVLADGIQEHPGVLEVLEESTLAGEELPKKVR